MGGVWAYIHIHNYLADAHMLPHAHPHTLTHCLTLSPLTHAHTLHYLFTNLLDLSTENLTKVFGEKLRNQVEDRLKFYETGNIPRKNVEVMSEALEEHNQLVSSMAQKGKKRKLEDVNGKFGMSILC